jgi:hypothetical protein
MQSSLIPAMSSLQVNLSLDPPASLPTTSPQLFAITATVGARQPDGGYVASPTSAPASITVTP